MRTNPIAHLFRDRPEDKAQAHTWASQSDLLEFLESQRSADKVALFVSGGEKAHLLLHTALAPAEDVRALKRGQRSQWEELHSKAWHLSIVTGGGGGARVEFGPNVPEFGGKLLDRAQLLVFHRDFAGRTVERSYFEVAQFFVHAHDLHWTPERHAYCRFDNEGDVEDFITVEEHPGVGGREGVSSVFVKKDVLEAHLAATGTVLLQMFDSTRIGDSFSGWSDEGKEYRFNKDGLHYRSHIDGNAASWFRGTQVIRPKHFTPKYAVGLLEGKQPRKKYETFLVQDWKNGRLAKVSCAPDAMASYFEESPLPYETSPVFFKPAVLDKYKADPDKYTLEQRSITCRNSWHLQTYHVNDEGQVHTYLKYLGNLPHAEQVYWKSFNEDPKGPISKRAFTTDFEGRFDTEPEPLRDLIHIIESLNRDDLPWFKLREPDLLKQLHYPLTTSTKEWGEVLKTLVKVVAESFEQAFFKQKATALGAKDDPQMRSIGWAKELLTLLGLTKASVTAIIQPLRDAQDLRSKLDAHTGGKTAQGLRSALLKKYETPRKHIEALCRELATSLDSLQAVLATKGNP